MESFYRKLAFVFKVSLVVLAMIICLGYTFSVKMLGIVVFSYMTVWVISKLMVAVALMGTTLLGLFLVKGRLPAKEL